MQKTGVSPQENLGLEETVKIGIVGATAHPQVDYSKGNNSKKPYALAPTQVINYVSCHDDLMLTDKLAKSLPGESVADRSARPQARRDDCIHFSGHTFHVCR